VLVEGLGGIDVGFGFGASDAGFEVTPGRG